MDYAISLDDVRAAAKRIEGKAHRTPVATCSKLDAMAGRQLFFKCENLQKVGAFKFRGACNAVMQLSEVDAANGVVTHSSGNHAQALALAARMREIDAHIVMPENSSPVKFRAVEGYGARIIRCESKLIARETTADQVIVETGGKLIHAYDHPDIMAGQGTVSLELLEQTTKLDALVIPVGGGGLLSGNCIAAKAINPSIRIFAAEPAGADDCAQSMASGQLVPQTSPNTIADGLLTSLGELTWPIIRDHVERVIVADDDAVIAAMRLAWERAKLLIEPSSAVAVAAALSDEFKSVEGIERVGVVLSGGNVNLDALPW